MNTKSIAHMISDQEMKLGDQLDVVDYDDISIEEYSNILDRITELNMYVEKIIERQKSNKD